VISISTDTVKLARGLVICGPYEAVSAIYAHEPRAVVVAKPSLVSELVGHDSRQTDRRHSLANLNPSRSVVVPCQTNANALADREALSAVPVPNDCKGLLSDVLSKEGVSPLDGLALLRGERHVPVKGLRLTTPPHTDQKRQQTPPHSHQTYHVPEQF
jgi:hypothetical protein